MMDVVKKSVFQIIIRYFNGINDAIDEALYWSIVVLYPINLARLMMPDYCV